MTGTKPEELIDSFYKACKIQNMDKMYVFKTKKQLLPTSLLQYKHPKATSIAASWFYVAILLTIQLSLSGKQGESHRETFSLKDAVLLILLTEH